MIYVMIFVDLYRINVSVCSKSRLGTYVFDCVCITILHGETVK